MNCLFASDLHGRRKRYKTLFDCIHQQRPDLVFLGGDLLPPFGNLTGHSYESFFVDFLYSEMQQLRELLGNEYPRIFYIFGNDDPGAAEEPAFELETQGLWTYLHNRWFDSDGYSICGYAYVPPTPFRLKDWERYDVSQYVDPGCISPEEGVHTIDVPPATLKYGTIQQDLQLLTEGKDLSQSIFLFHGPPHQTNLDRAALDGKKIDHVPLDVHVGSIAVRRFIELRQPLLTLHGHIHESARITGSWKDQIGRTQLFSAAHDGPELSLVRFNPHKLEEASRDLL
jgi:Icc-related predicted phosphoesterase